MQKIISLFQRNYETDHLVRNEVVPGAEWVLAGEGVATRKWDGTCCLIKNGEIFKRHDVKAGRIPPIGFIPAQDKDVNTGHWPGWLPVGDGPEDRLHMEAAKKGLDMEGKLFEDGTYELLGPRINGNPDMVAGTWLHRHGVDIIKDVPREFALLKAWFETKDIEGVVWHHPDGRMVKIKKRDFGYKR